MKPTTALLILHGLLMLATVAAVLEQTGSVLLRAVALVLALAPLVLALPGLLRLRKRTLQWLALVLVVYAGAGSLEIVASLGMARSSAAVLLIALIEITLLFSLSRRRDLRAADERTEQ